MFVSEDIKMEFTVKKFNEARIHENFSSYVLGIDIGGTHTNLGVAGIQDEKPVLLFSLNFYTKDLDSLVPAVEKTLSYAKKEYDIDVDFACIGAAGVVSSTHDYAELTNIPWNVSSEALTNITSLKSVYIINDYQSIGFSVNLLDKDNAEDILLVKPGVSESLLMHATKAIIGAGTGLGKSILNYSKKYDAYIPIASEGGHGDFPVYDDVEMQLVEYIKRLRGISQPLTYEELLSGRGVFGIYKFLRDSQGFGETEYTKEIDGSDDKAPLISKYRTVDEVCKETFRFFTRFYARCAKNYVLDTLSSGGLYIAGGIAAKNREIFQSKEFLDEFLNAYRRSDFLRSVPIYVIVNYDMSHYGACFAAMYMAKKDSKSI